MIDIVSIFKKILSIWNRKSDREKIKEMNEKLNTRSKNPRDVI